MSARLRIVHAVRSSAFAGVERFVLRLAERQSYDGHSVHVVGGDPARMRDPLAAAGVSFSPAKRTLETSRSIRRVARDADLVNTHMTAADVAAVLAFTGIRARPALVSTRHFTSVRGRGTGIPFDFLVGGRIDAEISISRAVAASTGRPSTVVHPGVESIDGPLEERRPVILMVQRLEAEKRTDLGIRAFAASGLSSEGWTLEIAGDGAERERLESLAAELGVRARFHGFRDDVQALMRRAALLLAPCPVEGLGLAVLEAMSSGTPVVAADAGGHTELLAGLDERALYAADDPAAAAGNLRSLAGDTAGREALSAAARERQRSAFSMESQADATESVYRAAIALRSAGVS